MDTLLESLRRIVGPNHVLTEGDLSAYQNDWRKRSQGRALAVVRPCSTQEVADVVKACAAAGVARGRVMPSRPPPRRGLEIPAPAGRRSWRPDRAAGPRR